jgi:hypothetical protein
MEASQIEVRVKGKLVQVPSVQIEGRTLITSGSWLSTAALQDEELIVEESVPLPENFISQVRDCGLNADMFTFSQKLWESEAKYGYHHEWDNWAVVPITTYSEWEKGAESSVRRAVRRAAKLGVEVKVRELDDYFLAGVVGINDEVPIRQGRAFWHYKKDPEEVRKENSTYPGRNIFLGAYLGTELIGWARIILAGKVASLVQILSKMQHYDKRPTNALLAKSVEVCAERGILYLTYCNFIYHDPGSSLTEFKRRNGFKQFLVPRYYVPLTAKGKMALSLGMHRGLVHRIPKPLLIRLLHLRNSWYERQLKDDKQSD